MIHLVKHELHYEFIFWCNKRLSWFNAAKQLPKHVYTDPDTSVKFTEYTYRTDCPDCLQLFNLAEQEAQNHDEFIEQDEDSFVNELGVEDHL